MKKSFSFLRLLIAFFISVNIVEAQAPLQWINSFEGPSYFEDRAYQMAYDSNGNLIISGAMENGCTDIDYVTIKMDPLGNELWRQYYSLQNQRQEDIPNALYVDAQNNIYVTGQSDSNYIEQAATIKYSPAGQQLWVQRFTNGRTIAYDVKADAMGNVYVCATRNVSNNRDIILIKYNIAGVQQWIQAYDNSTTQEAIKMVFDPFGYLYVLGQCALTGNGYDITLLKYNNNGVQQWVRNYNGPQNTQSDYAVDIKCDKDANILVLGHVRYFSAANHDYCVIKYDSSGSILWQQAYHHQNDDTPKSMDLDQDNNIYVTGFSGGNGTMYDATTVKFSNSGSVVWSFRHDSIGLNDYGWYLKCDTINNKVYTTASITSELQNGYDQRDVVLYEFDTSGTNLSRLLYQSEFDGFDLSYQIALNLQQQPTLCGVGVYDFPFNNDMNVLHSNNMQWSWIKHFNGQGFADDQGKDMVVAKNGTTYSCGLSNGTENTSDFVVIKNNPNGLRDWYYRYDGPYHDNDVALAITIDDLGNVYATGTTDSINGGKKDIYTVKLDASGNKVWEDTYKGSAGGNDVPASLWCDSNGNLYVAATIIDTISVSNLSVLCYDTNGNIKWTFRHDTLYTFSSVYAMEMDSDGNLILAGTQVTPGLSSTDGLIVKIDTLGNLIWAATYDSDSTLTNDSEFYNCLTLYGTEIFAAGMGLNNCITSKFNSNGTLAWSKVYSNTTNRDSAAAIINDALGNVYVANAAYQFSGSDISLVKYSNQGNEIWAKKYSPPVGTDDLPSDLAIDDSANVYLTGHITLTYTTNFNFITLKYDSAGNLKWNASFTDSLGNSPDYGKRIGLDTAGNIYVMGNANQPCFGNTFFNGYRFNITTLKYGYGSSVFIAENEHELAKLHLFPNPSTGRFTIKTPNGEPIELVSVFDLQGREVPFEQIKNNDWSDIKLKKHRSGIYFIKVVSGKSTFMVKGIVN